MFKRIIVKVFYNYYNLSHEKNTSKINSSYNSFGMVIPNNEKVVYYASPVIASRKCIKASRRKFGFKAGDSVDLVFEKIYDYYENVNS